MYLLGGRDFLRFPMWVAIVWVFLLVKGLAAVRLIGGTDFHDVVGLVKRGDSNLRHVRGHVVDFAIAWCPSTPVVWAAVPDGIFLAGGVPVRDEKPAAPGGYKGIVDAQKDAVNIELRPTRLPIFLVPR